jgi:hypothetical protein
MLGEAVGEGAALAMGLEGEVAEEAGGLGGGHRGKVPILIMQDRRWIPEYTERSRELYVPDCGRRRVVGGETDEMLRFEQPLMQVMGSVMDSITTVPEII